MSTQVVAFVCDFCPRKKRFASKVGVTRHEKNCFYNPARRACATCEHFIPAERESSVENPYGYVTAPRACAEDAFRKDPEDELRFACDSWKLKEPQIST